MRLEGRLLRPEGPKCRFWAVEIPMLYVWTQGRTKSEAYEMAKDAIESLDEEYGFRIKIYPGSDDTFTIGSNNPKKFIAFVLKRTRIFQGLTVREVAKRLGSRSPNSYAQYETGRICPTIDKFVELMRALNPEFEPVLKAA